MYKRQERYSSFFRVFAEVFIRFMFHLSAITYSNDYRVHKNYSTDYVIKLPSAHAFGNSSSFLRCLCLWYFLILYLIAARYISSFTPISPLRRNLVYP